MFKNVSHTPSFIVLFSCYKSRFWTFFELILKAYTRRVPKGTAIFQDWAHQSFAYKRPQNVGWPKKPNPKLTPTRFPNQISGVCISLRTQTPRFWVSSQVKSSQVKSIWAASWQNQQSECEPSEDSDQPPGHPLSAWRKLGPLATHWAHSEDTDQTGRMPRLIWVFAGRTATLLVLSRGGL